GQGIQLLSKTLALAATRAGRHAMLSAEVGGEMRGGPSLASVVVADEPVRALPILEAADAMVLAHHKFSGKPVSRLLPGGLCLVNASVVEEADQPPGVRCVRVPAASVAKELGAPQAGGLVLLGAFNAVTGLVPADALVEAMRELLPPYRQQHVASNAAALAAGADLVSGLVPALDPFGAAVSS
ncbi:MAG: 2-oxoacid:acceptor oxidoreductase family protein, partial [Lapillicoccus sp.]